MNKMLVWFAMLLAGVATAAQPDFNGVWQVTEYRTQLHPEAGGKVPLLPEAAARYKETLAAFGAGDVSFDLTAHQCASPGIPRALLLPYPFEIIQTSQQITFLFEWNHLFRAAPVGVVREYAYTTAMGASKATWDGEVLVVHTDNLTDTTFLDASGLPHSEALQITERYQLARDGQHMTVRFRFEDPETFTAPWEASATFQRLPKYTLKEDVCLDRQARGKKPVEHK